MGVLGPALEVEAGGHLRRRLDPVVPAHANRVPVVPEAELGRLAEQWREVSGPVAGGEHEHVGGQHLPLAGGHELDGDVEAPVGMGSTARTRETLRPE
nr:hypothetical protein HEP87_46060 [Streptomyces sp. S1D4-11]